MTIRWSGLLLCRIQVDFSHPLYFLWAWDKVVGDSSSYWPLSLLLPFLLPCHHSWDGRKLLRFACLRFALLDPGGGILFWESVDASLQSCGSDGVTPPSTAELACDAPSQLECSIHPLEHSGWWWLRTYTNKNKPKKKSLTLDCWVEWSRRIPPLWMVEKRYTGCHECLCWHQGGGAALG